MQRVHAAAASETKAKEKGVWLRRAASIRSGVLPCAAMGYDQERTSYREFVHMRLALLQKQVRIRPYRSIDRVPYRVPLVHPRPCEA